MTFHRWMPLEQRFWLQVFQTSGCWEWLGTKNQGYGLISHQGRSRRATHVSWFIARGVWPEPGKMLCHTCDNPTCVNPDHLFVGDAKINAIDAFQKGRRRGWLCKKAGEDNGNAKLTAVDVAAIRSSAQSAKALAKQYGVGTTTIYRVRRGDGWRA